MPGRQASCVICREAAPHDVAQLHLHVFPRYDGDPFSGRPIDGANRGFHRSRYELDRLAAAVQRELQAMTGDAGTEGPPAIVRR